MMIVVAVSEIFGTEEPTRSTMTFGDRERESHTA